MKKLLAALKPATGILLFALLYGVTLPFRPLFAPGEYDFAAFMLKIFPGMTGNILPKLPALAATMLTATLVLLLATRMRLSRPWIATVVYLVLPPVWFFGTSAAAEQIFALAVTLTVLLFYLGHKTPNIGLKTLCGVLAVPAAVGAAFILKWEHFSAACVLMAPVPLLSVAFAAYLEKLDDQGKATGLLNRLTFLLALLDILLLATLLVSPICRRFKLACPGIFHLYVPEGGILRPALSLVIPLLWFFLAKGAANIGHKVICLAVGIGFVILTLPASLPWSRLIRDMPGEAVMQLKEELQKGSPTCFADVRYAGAIEYQLRLPVTLFGRGEGKLRPAELRSAIADALRSGDVLVALSDRDYDSYLPKGAGQVYQSGAGRRIIRYSGGRK